MTTLDLAGRAAALVLAIALTGNTLLVALSPRNTWLEYAIVLLSSVTAIGLLARILGSVTRMARLAALGAAVVWALTFLSLGISYHRDVTWEFMGRQGSFYLAFFVGSVSLYYVEKLHLDRPPDGM